LCAKELKLERGTIVRAVAPGDRGQSKPRPLVIISDPNALQDEDSTLVAVAISSSSLVSSSLTYVDLPWDAEGRARTGLRKPSTAVCDWIVEISADEITEIKGHLPAAPLALILEKVGIIHGTSQ